LFTVIFHLDLFPQVARLECNSRRCRTNNSNTFLPHWIESKTRHEGKKNN